MSWRFYLYGELAVGDLLAITFSSCACSDKWNSTIHDRVLTLGSGYRSQLHLVPNDGRHVTNH